MKEIHNTQSFHNTPSGCVFTVTDKGGRGNALLVATSKDNCGDPLAAGDRSYQARSINTDHTTAAGQLDVFRAQHPAAEVTHHRRLGDLAPELGALVIIPELDDQALRDQTVAAELDGVLAPEFQA